MFEQFWNGILELTAKFVIPDWGSVVAMLPVFVLVLSVMVIAALFWRLARAPKPGRGKRRIEPVAPQGVHMPGPSWAPVFAAIGTFLLFLGLVFGGPILILGLIALALTLLYWLVEAVRIYEHDVGATAPPLPVVVHDGPPPGVHMPGPSFRPILGAIGTAMLFLGLVFGEWLLAVGVIALFLTLVGWLGDARQEYLKTVEADATGHLEPLPAPRTPNALLAVLALLLIGGFVIQAGWLPPHEASGAAASGGPPASGEPGGSGAPPPSGPAADVTIHAKGVAFVETSITAPADKPFTIAFVNEDQGTPHNVALHEGSPTGKEAFKGEIFPGVATKVYKVPPLPAGTYGFACTVHPSMTGTATLQ
ncbi:MAG TPA: cytochrome c oxidase subunit 4 [Candidatus Limnocylindrales bacterium]|jgi:plastocyanin|nr:cytochrome c oxidase subunit 4 [Candidatus Limnocylindrales bacterium]